MKSVQSLAEALSRGKALAKEKESETNWSKIDQVLEEVGARIDGTRAAEDALGIVDLMVSAVQSNRSKLSGTGCKVLSQMFEVLGETMQPHLLGVFTAAVCALGKTNKVISARALSLVHTIGATCNVRPLRKQLKAHAASPSRAVKQGVLELCIQGVVRDGHTELSEVIEGFLSDPAADIRMRAREGVVAVGKVDKTRYADIVGKLPEKTQHLISPSKAHASKPRERIVPSVIAPITVSPRQTIKTKETGNSIVVRGPMRAYITDTTTNIEIRKALKPGYSLERIGLRLEEHKKEITEALKKERTPRKTPVKIKRPREGEETPSFHLKKEKEDPPAYSENHIANLSQEILNLSIIHTEGTDQIVETKEVHDNIFIGEEIKGSKGFLESCELAADTTSECTPGDYSVLAPEVMINKATVKKI